MEVGDEIVVHGLKAAAELNGCQGVITKFIEASDRFEVKLKGIADVKALKRANLREKTD